MNNDEVRCFRLFRSGIPDKSVPVKLGIDEAGRGPVLGPMVYGGFVCPIGERCHTLLKGEIGVDDSKKLTPDHRNTKFRQLNAPDRPFAICAEVITPKFISYRMLQRESYNLNAMSHDSAIAIIRHFISQGFNLKEVYVDAVGPAAKYEAKLKQLFPQLHCVVANKADSKFPVVSAASIVAKVIRDNMIESWFKDAAEPVQVGSGYPGDPVTCQFLASSLNRLFGFSEFVRFSWATAKNMLEDPKRAAPFEWYETDVNDEEAVLRQNTAIRQTHWLAVVTVADETDQVGFGVGVEGAGLSTPRPQLHAADRTAAVEGEVVELVHLRTAQKRDMQLVGDGSLVLGKRVATALAVWGAVGTGNAVLIHICGATWRSRNRVGVRCAGLAGPAFPASGAPVAAAAPTPLRLLIVEVAVLGALLSQHVIEDRVRNSPLWVNHRNVSVAHLHVAARGDEHAARGGLGLRHPGDASALRRQFGLCDVTPGRADDLVDRAFHGRLVLRGDVR
ncbi:ribonuclease H1 large subunit, putative [Babesia caballi]|uniref:Ribonuclease n=1 Tax=Babesia caballi TaxID=5871 RepID=A0AAV4LQB6_BABCB|nr:ribonuclease H1 large subunit, putative [Babesia caballi]